MAGTSTRKIRLTLTFSILAIVLLMAFKFFNLGNLIQLFADNAIQSEDLERIPANQWLRYHQPFYADWRRQGHAGIAYDTQRATFYIFGSDIHGEDWDNSVHEFDPKTKSWSTHYPPADPGTYRIDKRGVGVSGDDRILPWAMHTFDNILYDPINDALVVTSKPDHNPISKTLGQSPRIHPTWFYYLPLKTWLTPENMEQAFPDNFAGSSAYDDGRRVIMSYGSGLAELGPDRDEWRKVPVNKPHQLHHSMEYDSLRKQLFVFGDYHNSNTVWVYTPGHLPGEAGSWEKKEPGGDYCPPDQHFPVAFDKHNGVFLLVPDNNPGTPTEDDSKVGGATSSSTFVYDPDHNEYQKLPGADLPAQRMNYMMVYDSRRRVFFLVTGDWQRPPVVWVLRLELASLQQ
jgi:hypothetical protein